MGFGGTMPAYSVQEAMRIFAKYHVEKALEKASKVPLKDFGGYIPFTSDWKEDYGIDEEAILNSYSLENIK